MLGTSWLWDRVRVSGGAYGGFSSFDHHTGLMTFLSYRDPNLLKTVRHVNLLPENLLCAASPMLLLTYWSLQWIWSTINNEAMNKERRCLSPIWLPDFFSCHTWMHQEFVRAFS